MNRGSMIAAQPDFTKNGWLDDFEFHFGEWIKQIIDWTDQNLEWLLRAIEWPFKTLFDLLMSDDPGRTSIVDIPWYWVAIAFFVIGSVARNTKVGVTSALMVSACGLLGADYWSETTKTFGMIFVAVLICAIIGIPLGILCGRIDGIWTVTRPVLDAMQVVHPFVYMLPFVYFWKVGEVSGTMATMVFAFPPIVRLTNLGVRQVPEDVVEASRSYGASELRVLRDVQLPLARPAIMAGLNQTLLLAISMLGIAAIMQAGGLGRLLLQAISSNDLARAASGGLAFFFVAVVLDRISQGQADDGLSIFHRIRDAWQYRADPEGLLAERERRADDQADIGEVEDQPAERPEPVVGRERVATVVAIVAAAVALLATLLPWANDSGPVSAYGRRADMNLLDESFNGWSSSGGSIFGWWVAGFSVLGILACLRPLLNFRPAVSVALNRLQGVLFGLLGAGAFAVWLLNLLGNSFGVLPTLGLIVFGVALLLVAMDTFVRGTPRLGADGALMAFVSALGAAAGFVVLNPPDAVESFSLGIGAYVALLSLVVAALAAFAAVLKAPYGPRRALRLSVRGQMILGGFVAAALILLGVLSNWFVDERTDELPASLQAQIDTLKSEAGDDVNKQIANGQQITNLIEKWKTEGEAPAYSAFDSRGPRTATIMLVLGGLGALVLIVGSGLVGGDFNFRWRAATLGAALGLASAAIPGAWILSFTRSAEPAANSGPGAFFALAGSFILFAAGQSMVSEFRRRSIYAAVSGVGSNRD